MKACDNPFSACRIDNISYRPLDTSIEQLLEKLSALNYRAAIIGEHGRGKTTLLETLKDRLKNNGFNIKSIFINDTSPLTRQKRTDFLKILKPNDLVFVDGADRLNIFTWRRFKFRIFQLNCGLVITSHKAGMLPTLIECSTTCDMFIDLAVHLTGDNYR
jgi:hypothetical protein